VRRLGVGDAVGYGWSVYWKNVATLVVIGIVVVGIDLVISAVARSVDNLGVQLVIQFAALFLSLLISLGWIRVSLEVTRGVQPTLGDLFRFEGYGPYVGAAILFALGFYVGLILFVVPGLIFAVTFGFFGFVIAERGDDIGVIESLRASADLTRGNRWPLFGLGIVLFLINLVGVLAFVVGLIFTLGITIIAWAYAYRTLRGEPVATWQ
jgi:uncharacterized membrane protein